MFPTIPTAVTSIGTHDFGDWIKPILERTLTSCFDGEYRHNGNVKVVIVAPDTPSRLEVSFVEGSVLFESIVRLGWKEYRQILGSCDEPDDRINVGDDEEMIARSALCVSDVINKLNDEQVRMDIHMEPLLESYSIARNTPFLPVVIDDIPTLYQPLMENIHGEDIINEYLETQNTPGQKTSFQALLDKHYANDWLYKDVDNVFDMPQGTMPTAKDMANDMFYLYAPDEDKKLRKRALAPELHGHSMHEYF